MNALPKKWGEKMTTIEDVAKKASTSIATVSRVLNNKKGFSEETRQRVLNAIEETGYESNAIAKSLKTNKTHTIGVIIPNISSMLSNQILNGIEQLANNKDYSVIVSYTYSKSNKVMKSLKTFNEQRVDGILFTSDFLTDEYAEYINRMNIPVILVATESPKYKFPFVKVNDFEASSYATNYLINKGHRNIGLISGPQDDPIAGAQRIEGFVSALENANIPLVKTQIAYNADFSFEDGKRSFEKILTNHPEITAIFSASDEMAIGALRRAHEMGVKIPEDISLVGYDNIQISSMVWPALSTISQPLEEIGYKATELLINMMERKNVDKEGIYIPFTLIERESVK